MRSTRDVFGHMLVPSVRISREFPSLDCRGTFQLSFIHSPTTAFGRLLEAWYVPNALTLLQFWDMVRFWTTGSHDDKRRSASSCLTHFQDGLFDELSVLHDVILHNTELQRHDFIGSNT
ncbi:uncharacterized protein [Montipora capricornis]|uniref:uncharacterized protein isoform X2 n=1 Tax=Montipora capricornis TaxID=246305 RepID=UPI0035F217F9